MKIVIAQTEDAVREYCGKQKANRLVNDIGFRLSCLSNAFTDVHAMVGLEDGRVKFALPLCRYNGQLEVLGQFWGEGFDLGMSENDWLECRRLMTGPVRISYCDVQYPGMKPMEVDTAELLLPETSQVEAYEARFTDSDSRRTLRQSLRYTDDITIDLHNGFYGSAIDEMIKFSLERLSIESRFAKPEHVESFVRMCEWLSENRSLVTLRYLMEDNCVGSALLSMDAQTKTLTFLSGFFAERLNNFGKYMYHSFVRVAEDKGCSRIVALMPLSRIKKDMQYTGRRLFEYVQ